MSSTRQQSKRGIFLFYAAGGLLVLAFVLGWFVSTPSALEILHKKTSVSSRSLATTINTICNLCRE
jgi:hypothetical protein